MTESNKKPHVLIVGAGICGLLIAQGLKKHDIPFTIYEKETKDQFRPREWGLSMHWALPYLEKLLPAEMWEKRLEQQCDPTYNPPAQDGLPIYNSQTGEHIKDMPLPVSIRVMRRKMRAFCAQGIDVQYGKSLKNIAYNDDGTVTAEFEDGTNASGTALVGSDGPHSSVRKNLFGEEEAATTKIGIIFSNIEVCYNDREKAEYLRKWHPVHWLGLHPKGYFNWVSIQNARDPERPEAWSFQVMNSYKISDEEKQARPLMDDAPSLSKLKAMADDLAEPFKSAITWIPEGTQFFESNVSYWVTKPWDNKDGRVALAGDAAHPLPPHRGQGTNQSICDASHYVDAIVKAVKGEESLADAVGAYCKEVQERGANEVELSKKNALMVHDWEQVSKSPLMERGSSGPQTAAMRQHHPPSLPGQKPL